MITPTDAERLFTSGFTRFIEPAARDVRFRLTFPQALDQLQSSSEEISESADEVRPTNFAYGSEQFFLELFTGPEALDGDERITLDVTYTDEAGESARRERLAKRRRASRRGRRRDPRGGAGQRARAADRRGALVPDGAGQPAVPEPGRERRLHPLPAGDR